MKQAIYPVHLALYDVVRTYVRTCVHTRVPPLRIYDLTSGQRGDCIYTPTAWQVHRLCNGLGTHYANV